MQLILHLPSDAPLCQDTNRSVNLSSERDVTSALSLVFLWWFNSPRIHCTDLCFYISTLNVICLFLPYLITPALMTTLSQPPRSDRGPLPHLLLRRRSELFGLLCSNSSRHVEGQHQLVVAELLVELQL